MCNRWFLLVFNYLDNKQNKKNLIEGFVLLLVGFLIRKEQFLAISSMMIISYFPLLKKNNLKSVSITIVFCICACTFYIYDLNAYNNDKWNKYLTYNKLRSEVLDIRLPDFHKNIEIYKELNIYENEYQLFKNWAINDPGRITESTLKALSKITKNNKTKECNHVYLEIRNFIFSDLKVLNLNIIFLIFVCLYIMLNNFTKTNIFLFILMFLCFFIDIIICLKINEIFKFRVIFSLASAIVVLMFYYNDFIEITKKAIGNDIYYVFSNANIST